MRRKLNFLIFLIMALSLASSVANADLVAGYGFDGNFKDASGNEFTGVPTAQDVGFSTNVPPGHVGQSLSLQLGGYVEIPLGIANPILDDIDGFTVMCWTLCDPGGEWPWPMVSSNGNVQQADWFMGADVEGGEISYFMDVWYVNAFYSESFDPALWHHVALVYEGGEQWTYYVDGEVSSTGSMLINDDDRSDFVVRIGGGDNGDVPGVGGIYVGLLDDVGIFDTALTEEEIKQIMDTGIGIGPALASDPNPADRATDVPRDVILGWEPGEYANTHDVYLGTVFDDVNDADRSDPRVVLANQGQIVTTYDPPGRLDFGQTYYWRIDEVNAPPDYTIFKGTVWSFTVEPFAYPIDGNNITATASSSSPDQGPENTVNGSGLDVNDLDVHSNELTAMWISDAVGPQPTWIQYEFDKVYKLHEMLVWNHNGTMEAMVGIGFKDVSIEYSVNGTDYTTLGTTHEFAQGTGSADYEHNTTVDFGGAAAKFVRLTANSNWVGFLPQYGLSEVRFLYIPVHAIEPGPDSGATDVDVEATLSWRAGREAAGHNVYLGTDEQAVIDGTAPVTTVTEASYSTPPLDVDSTYYWRVDEVNDAETPTTWQGEIWSFTTPEFLVVDDFELYNDLNPEDPESNRIFNTWIDGYGIATNGSIVGNDVAPFAEQGIVSGGSQSMPFSYDNSTAGNSEATANVANLQIGQDWTKGATETLVLWIRGALSNAAADQLYVKINDTKVIYGGDLSEPIYKQWNVDLASLGISLSNITTLSIGVDGGGSGMLYVDDIALYRIAPPVVEPTPGGDRSLVAHWKLDETSGLTAADSSGYGNDGTLIGMTGTEWTAGIRDGALELAGGTAATPKYVDFGNAKSLQLFDSATISAWVKMNDGNADAYMGIGGKLISGYYKGFSLVRHSSNVFRLWCDDGAGVLANASSDATYTDTEWHHVVGVIDNGTSILYVDGVRQAQEGSVDLTGSVGIAYIGKQYGDDSSHRYWNGLIDDVRIYYRALSEQEISGL